MSVHVKNKQTGNNGFRLGVSWVQKVSSRQCSQKGLPIYDEISLFEDSRGAKSVVSQKLRDMR